MADKLLHSLSRCFKCCRKNILRDQTELMDYETVNVEYFECVSVSLFIPHAMPMRRIILSSVDCLTVPYFSHYLINCTILRDKSLLNIRCV
jgi:hypothetical protein